MFAGPARMQLISFCKKSVYVWHDNNEESIVIPAFFGGLRIYDDPLKLTFNGFFEIRDGHNLDPGVRGAICIGSPFIVPDTFSAIMEAYQAKTISFWFDLSLSQQNLINNPQQTTGIITIGSTYNNMRYFLLSAVTFLIKDINELGEEMPYGWLSMDLVDLHIKDFDQSFTTRVIFDIEAQKSLVPQKVYDAVVGRLKVHLRNPFWTSGALPDELMGKISEFVGPVPQHMQFRCEFTRYLNAMKLDELIITPDMLYDKTDDGYCYLRISPLPESAPNYFLMGFHIIKNFYFSVTFDRSTGSHVQFSKRKGFNRNQPIKNSCVIC